MWELFGWSGQVKMQQYKFYTRCAKSLMQAKKCSGGAAGYLLESVMHSNGQLVPHVCRPKKLLTSVRSRDRCDGHAFISACPAAPPDPSDVIIAVNNVKRPTQMLRVAWWCAKFISGGDCNLISLGAASCFGVFARYRWRLGAKS